MMFTTFLLLTSVAIVLGLAGLLALRWQAGPLEARVPFGPLAVAALTAGLVAMGFLVI